MLHAKTMNKMSTDSIQMTKVMKNFCSVWFILGTRNPEHRRSISLDRHQGFRSRREERKKEVKRSIAKTHFDRETHEIDLSVRGKIDLNNTRQDRSRVVFLGSILIFI